MDKLLKTTLAFLISAAMIFTCTSVSFAAPGDVEAEGVAEPVVEAADVAETSVAFQIVKGGKTFDVTVSDMRAAAKVEVPEEAPWYFNSTSPCFGTFYNLKSILTNAGIDTQDITGVSAFATDGFISSYADSDVDNIYVFDMSEVSRNGSYGTAGTYGAGLYKEDGSAAGNTWPTNIVNITMAKASDFAEAAVGSKYYNTLANAIAAKGKKDKKTGEYMRNDITMLKDVTLEGSVIDTHETASLDLNGRTLAGKALVKGAENFLVQDLAAGEPGRVEKFAVAADGFTGTFNCSLANYLLKDDNGLFTFAIVKPAAIQKAPKVTAAKKALKVTSWAKVDGAVKYQISVSTKKKGTSVKKTVKKVQKVTVKKLKAKKVYYVKVRAVNVRGACGGWSPVKKIKTK